ncbi:nuclear transport factor 2 family protein [Streptomyces sp. RFCAC02]|uniref:nuclear transport factor 2 family protein n=1 Tax=Streptomyces sp. RFCAC02 TaxID=2499143 RepID=UPI0010229C36|nr:nuclear transport factor 2 family protein [Streptomyces sp. RFCAC02]
MPSTERDPLSVLARYRRAMLTKSADDLADLYAPDGVHEFPFAFPGVPGRLAGREAVRETYRALWGATPVTVRAVHEVAVHTTGDPAVIVAEQTAVTAGADGSERHVPGLLVLRVGDDGLLTHVRDYMDTGAVQRARATAG